MTVNGTFDMNGSDVSFLNQGSSFNLGPNSTFTWAPSTNTSSGASLFLNGVENFNTSSTIVISKWYDYTVPLGEVVTGNFGNVVINTPGGNNSVVEWNQKNYFEEHRIEGTLTIDCGWVTLDKSGSVSTTTIGKIILASINSTFIAHNGTHPSAFSLYTTSVTNNGGRFYGLNDGNGNINLLVSGDFINSGNVKIINNSGVSGVSNGNAFVRVDGDFIQTAGDTRMIYNLSTTNSGVFTAAFNNLILSGGIFMGQNACHTGGRLNLLNITKDFTVNFQEATDKFRGTGLSSIGQYVNNAGLAINVGRNLSINGISQAEFTSSASSGDELINVNGEATISGCTTNFNFGTPNTAHSAEFNVTGNLNMNGGTFCLSGNNGTIKSRLSRNLNMNGGTLILKGNKGKALLTVNGNFDQRGGTVIHHSNNTVPTSDEITILVNGNFKQSGGILNFDDNTTGVCHILSLAGDSCQFGGDGKITSTNNGSSGSPGMINYEKSGITAIQRSGNNHQIDNVCQTIMPACEVVVKSGNIMISSFSSQVQGFIVSKGGKLTITNNSSLVSNNVKPNCSVFVDSSAVVSVSSEKGLAGSPQAAFSSGVNYSLHAFSIVEYKGQKSANITGQSETPQVEAKKYGILRINISAPSAELKLNEDVNVRTKIELIEGKIRLNNHTLTIENGNREAVTRKNGFIESSFESSTSESKICWKKISTGKHEFPFGRSSELYLPLIYDVISGSGKDVWASTRRMEKANSASGSGFSTLSAALIEANAVERWWTVASNGINADITFTFCTDENNKGSSDLSALQWTGTTWTRQVPAFKNDNAKTTSLTLKNISNSSDFVIVNEENNEPFELKLFDAKKNEREVLLSWEAINESDNSVYTIEKSQDGVNFFEIGQKDENISFNNLSSYNFSDKELPESVSYYRLRYVNNQRTSYSSIKTVRSTDDYRGGPVKINSVNPNPFSSEIKIDYTVIDERTMIEVFDANGRQVLDKPLEVSGGENGTATLNLDFLTKGIYFITIINNGKKDTMKIIKNE